VTDGAGLIGNIIADLQRLGCSVEPCGSRVTCDPPPMDTDADYLVEVSNADLIGNVVRMLEARGFNWEGSEHYQNMLTNNFMSFRQDYINMIVTANADFAMKHRLATSLCKSFNLTPKPHRIALFQAVLYGQFYDPVANRIAPALVSLPPLVDADEPVF
jgi:hypothetical protein